MFFYENLFCVIDWLIQAQYGNIVAFDAFVQEQIGSVFDEKYFDSDSSGAFEMP